MPAEFIHCLLAERNTPKIRFQSKSVTEVQMKYTFHFQHWKYVSIPMVFWVSMNMFKLPLLIWKQKKHSVGRGKKKEQPAPTL